MPQLDSSSFISQIVGVTIIFFLSYTLVFNINIPSLSKLNWGRSLTLESFKNKVSGRRVMLNNAQNAKNEIIKKF